MRALLNLLFVLSGSVLLGQPNFGEATISELQSSTLRVSGKTNVTDFSCFFDPAYFEPQKKIAYCNQGDLILLRNAKLELNLAGFNCGGKAINKDFRAMLQAEQYPVIILNFKQFNRVERGYEALVNIALAGQQHTYTIPVEIVAGDLKHLKGILKLNISDYNLELPKKLFGLIKIKDVIAIEFDIAGVLNAEFLE
ncbi:YceI family protein [Leeuwenhoekiella marinoflava]|uniref:YceI family protein n=1 Tax=Leeuwenhoekiella marinoflava TaxID=988 RepID=UPI003001E1F6